MFGSGAGADHDEDCGVLVVELGNAHDAASEDSVELKGVGDLRYNGGVVPGPATLIFLTAGVIAAAFTGGDIIVRVGVDFNLVKFCVEGINGLVVVVRRFLRTPMCQSGESAAIG